MNHPNRRIIPLLERIHRGRGKKLETEDLNQFEVLLIDSCPRSSFRKGLKQMRHGTNIQTLAINREQDQAHRKRTYREISHLFDTLQTLPHLTTIHFLHCDNERDDLPLLTKYLLLSSPSPTAAPSLLLSQSPSPSERSHTKHISVAVCHQKLKEIRINANTISAELMQVLSTLPNLEILSLQAQTTPMEPLSFLPLLESSSLKRLCVYLMANQRYVGSPIQELIRVLGRNSDKSQSRLAALELRLNSIDRNVILQDVRELLIDNQTLSEISLCHGRWRDDDFVDTLWLAIVDVLSSSSTLTHHSPYLQKLVLRLPPNNIPGQKAQVALVNLLKNCNYTLCNLPTLRHYHEKNKQEGDNGEILEQINYYLDLNARGRGKVLANSHSNSKDEWLHHLLQGNDSLDWIYFVLQSNPAILLLNQRKPFHCV